MTENFSEIKKVKFFSQTGEARKEISTIQHVKKYVEKLSM